MNFYIIIIFFFFSFQNSITNEWCRSLCVLVLFVYCIGFLSPSVCMWLCLFEYIFLYDDANIPNLTTSCRAAPHRCNTTIYPFYLLRVLGREIEMEKEIAFYAGGIWCCFFRYRRKIWNFEDAFLGGGWGGGTAYAVVIAIFLFSSTNVSVYIGKKERVGMRVTVT